MKHEDILLEVKDRLLNNTGITNIKPGTIARELLDAYATEASSSYSYLDTRFTQALISQAAGDYLDQLGLLVGMSRDVQTLPFGEVSISINPDFGLTLADLKQMLIDEGLIAVGQDIEFMAGTIITDITGDIVYKMTENAILTDGESVVPVVGTAYGEDANVGVGELSSMVLTDPTFTSIVDYLIIGNTAPIDNGENKENDDNYRYRIINAFASHARANVIAVRLAALSVPGVSDVFIRNFEHGIGTYSVYVISQSPIVSTGVLSAVQEAINNVTAAGIRGIATNPDYEAAHLDIVLKFKPGVTPKDRDYDVNNVNSLIVDYINNLEVGETLIVNEIIAIALNSSDNIKDLDIGRFGRGTYNPSTGVIDDYEPLITNDQYIDNGTKWVTNKKLVTVCY